MTTDLAIDDQLLLDVEEQRPPRGPRNIDIYWHESRRALGLYDLSESTAALLACEVPARVDIEGSPEWCVREHAENPLIRSRRWGVAQEQVLGYLLEYDDAGIREMAMHVRRSDRRLRDIFRSLVLAGVVEALDTTPRRWQIPDHLRDSV